MSGLRGRESKKSERWELIKEERGSKAETGEIQVENKSDWVGVKESLSQGEMLNKEE